MTTPIKTSPSPLLWISSIAIILFSVVGIAAFMGWLPTAYGEQNTDGTSEVASLTDRPVTNKAICVDCGVIVSTQLINNVKNTSGVGLVGGAVVGGLLGNQIGGGRGKDLATVAGAVGGAVAGNEIEKSAGTSQHYEITVRFENGSSRAFNQVNQPTWQPGDRVRVIDGVIRSNG
ncbi:MAG: outer membrane lipoprotein SlyB [Marinomonas primoryensis]|jgi:outer membrane lipoprotein SlyB